MSTNRIQKQVGITPKAHAALESLKRDIRKRGVSMSLGTIASQLILAARPEDACKSGR